MLLPHVDGATILDSIEIDHFYHYSKFCRIVLFSGIINTNAKVNEVYVSFPDNYPM